MLIYKIVPQDLWQDAVAEGLFTGAEIDHEDGYIHFSTAEQVQETAAKHFAGQEDLLLVALDTERFSAIKWDVSRGGALFPHLYGMFRPDQVVWVKPLPLKGGVHVFPELGV